MSKDCWARPPVDRSEFLLFNEIAVSAANHNYSEEKLQQVILYFLEHINNVHLGRTKLMKLLYFVDFSHYEAHGQSVTRLQARGRGPPVGPVTAGEQIEAAPPREAPWAGSQAGKKIIYEMDEYRRAIGCEPLDESLAGSKKFADYVAALA